MAQQQLPADFGKMPANYDFSHKGIKWEDYRSDFSLRTDAVWEKEKLKDFFRLYMKCFYFDKSRNKYSMIEPEDLYTVLYEPWAMEDMIFKWRGFSNTGRTVSFQAGIPPRNKEWVPQATFQSQQDYFTLCALRFERWMQCDFAYQYNGNEDPEAKLKKFKDYPCYGLFYEASYACQDDAFDFLMEIHYAKSANQTVDYNILNTEMRSWPTVYDSPKNAERIKKTY